MKSKHREAIVAGWTLKKTVHDELITPATRAAHQAALVEQLRMKSDLAKIGICLDDFDVLERYALADFSTAIERNREV